MSGAQDTDPAEARAALAVVQQELLSRTDICAGLEDSGIDGRAVGKRLGELIASENDRTASRAIEMLLKAAGFIGAQGGPTKREPATLHQQGLPDNMQALLAFSRKLTPALADEMFAILQGIEPTTIDMGSVPSAQAASEG